MPRKHRVKNWFKRFARQELRTWTPVWTPYRIMAAWMALAILTIPFGVATLATALHTGRIRIRYDNLGPFASLPTNEAREAFVRSAAPRARSYDVTVRLPRTLHAPLYLYYEISGFFGSYRRYVRSVSSKQLKGKTNSATGKCEPLLHADLSNVEQDPAIGDVSAAGTIVPCGLIAWSLFNDTFSMVQLEGGVARRGQEITTLVGATRVPLDQSPGAIAYSGDYQGVLRVFGSQPAQYFLNNASSPGFTPAGAGGAAIPGPLDQDAHLMVWMRPSGTVRVRKPWARIDSTLAKGSVIVVRVNNAYNTYGYGGSKYFVLSEDSWMGMQNYVLPSVLLSTGGIGLLMALVALWAAGRRASSYGPSNGALGRQPGDLSLASWNQRPAVQRPIVAPSAPATDGDLGFRPEDYNSRTGPGLAGGPGPRGSPPWGFGEASDVGTPGPGLGPRPRGQQGSRRGEWSQANQGFSQVEMGEVPGASEEAG